MFSYKGKEATVKKKKWKQLKHTLRRNELSEGQHRPILSYCAATEKAEIDVYGLIRKDFQNTMVNRKPGQRYHGYYTYVHTHTRKIY